MDISNREHAFRLETYRSLGTVSSSMKTQLRCYFVTKCNFVDPSVSPDETNILKVSDKIFLSKASEHTLGLYQSIINAVLQRTGPVIAVYNIEESREKRLIIGYR